MLKFLKELPNIYVVFVAFILLFIGWVLKPDPNLFTLANTALGAIIGLAMKTSNPSQTNEIKQIDNANISTAENLEKTE